MIVEKFLSFWSQHNQTIIVILMGLAFAMSIYIVFRYFFSNEPPASDGGSVTATIDTSEIEKTLAKILENQSKAPVTTVQYMPGEGAAPSVPLDAAGASSLETMAELEELRKAISEKDRLIAVAKDEAAKAVAQAHAAAAAAAGKAPAQAASSDSINDSSE